MWAMIACSIAMAIWTTIVVFLSVRDEKREAARRDTLEGKEAEA
jgi:ACS family pantothenate transporter-like MFS transporter